MLQITHLVLRFHSYKSITDASAEFHFRSLGIWRSTAEVETVLKVNTHTYIEIGPPTELLCLMLF